MIERPDKKEGTLIEGSEGKNRRMVVKTDGLFSMSPGASGLAPERNIRFEFGIDGSGEGDRGQLPGTQRMRGVSCGRLGWTAELAREEVG